MLRLLESSRLHSVLAAATRMRPAVGGALVSLALWNVQAWASQTMVDELTQLMDQGKHAQAAQQVQRHLKQEPNDVQLRFLQGVIAAEQQRYDQAIQMFTALTQDYPSLPEPYNNLAVLHAAKGDERKAAQVLEQAIRTNPSYATAHENLGDLYARMASDAYTKALQLDNDRKTVQPKLSLITQVFPESMQRTAVAAAAQAVAPTPAVVPAPAPASPAASTMTAPTTRPAPLPAPTLAPMAPVLLTERTARATPPTVDVAQAETTKPPAAPASDTNTQPPAPRTAQQAENAVHAWAKAWAAQDIDNYLGAYSSRFKPADGSRLSDWKETRRNRIVGRNPISVKVLGLKVQVNGDKATASFRQQYASGSYKATTRKVLQLQREGKQWLILSESTGS